MCEHAGADAIGVVFYPPSKRHVEDLGLARDIALSVGPFTTVVGLFVSPAPEYINQVLATVPLGLIQFHGDETEGFCKGVGRPYMKAIRMKPQLDVCESMAAFPSAQGVLLDAYRPGVPGGTGEVFDWSRVPGPAVSTTLKPIVLAGGLTPQNVKRAVEQVKPWAVDVSGGVELSPGKKCKAKVADFIKNAKVRSQTA